MKNENTGEQLNMSNFDLDNLTDDEVHELMHALKHPSVVKSFTTWYQNIATELFLGTVDYPDQLVIDEIDNVKYILHARRGMLENRFSIHLRFKNNNMHLLRLDIGTTHRNPDGTRVDEDHVHIYVNSQKHSKHYAIPLSASEFPNVKNFADALTSFLEYTNIQREAIP
jgi:hypothetical protein